MHQFISRSFGGLWLLLGVLACASGGDENAAPAGAGGGMPSAGASSQAGTAGANGGFPAAGGGPSEGGASAGAAGTTAGVGGVGSSAGSGGAAGGVSGSGGSGAGGGGAAGAAGASNEVQVFLIAGQSNATGQGYTKNIPKTFVINTQVQLFHSSAIISGATANIWIPLRHASEAPDSGGDRFGPELGFGTTIQELYPGRQIALIKHAVSATNLVSQWAPGADAKDTSHFGGEFKTFVATVDKGLAALRAKGQTPIIRGMLWQQGEADADIGGTASSQYGQHLAALIARVREQWQVPDMLFIYGYVYPKSNYGSGRDQVRLGEKNVDQDSGNALAVKGAFVVETDDLQLRANDPGTPYPSDLIHFGSAGQLELGKRMAAKTHAKLALP